MTELNRIMHNIETSIGRKPSDAEKIIICIAVNEICITMPKSDTKVNSVLTRVQGQLSIMIAETWRERAG